MFSVTTGSVAEFVVNVRKLETNRGGGVVREDF